MTSPCDAWLESIPDRVAGHLAPAAARAFDAHVADCDGCREALQDWRCWHATALEAVSETAPPGAELALARVLAAGDEARPVTPWRRRPVWALAAALAVLALGLLSVGTVPVDRSSSQRGGGERTDERPPRVAIGRVAPGRIQDPSGADATRPSRQERSPDARGVDPDRLRQAAPRRRTPAGEQPEPGGASDIATVPTGAGTGTGLRDVPKAGGDGAARDPEPAADAGQVPAQPRAPEPGPTHAERRTPVPATSAPASPPPASVTASPPIGTPMPAPTASARVAGRVEDPEGRGLAWALVYLRPEVDTGDRFLLTDTALDGSFELVLPAGRYRLVVEHEGFEPAWYGGSEPGVLELTPSESVVGLILRLAPANGPPGPAAGGGSPIAPPPGDIGIRPPEPSNPEPEAARPSREPKEGMA